MSAAETTKAAILVAIGLLCAWPVFGSGPDIGPVQFQASALVAVDAEGVPQQAEASALLPAHLREIVEHRAMALRFKPVVIDGERKGGTTHVFLQGCILPGNDGSLRIAMDYSHNGPGYADGALRLPPLAYPRAAWAAGVQGSFELIVLVAADGSASIESIEGRRRDLRPFREALETWVASMRYVPEQIDGVPVATRISIFTDFVIGEYAASRRVARDQAEQTRLAEAKASKQCIDAARDERTPPSVALDSPFKLLSAD